MGIRSVLIIALFMSLGIFESTEGAKILSIFPYSGPSQYIFISPLLKALAEKGHEVTSISTFPQKKPLKNFRDIAVMENSKIFDEMLIEMAGGESEEKSFFQEFVELSALGVTVTTNVMENSEVKNLLKNEKFDLLIIEVLSTESLLGLGEYFQAPMIGVSTFGTIGFIDYLTANPSPASFIPHMSLQYGSHMSLWERTVNVLANVVDDLCLNYLMLPDHEKVYKKYFPNAKLSMDEARRNVSLVLLNDHFSLRAPRPYVPNMIEVGGLHIKQKPDPLEEDLQKFLDNSPEGVIYFSMGSNVKSKDLPPQTLQAILGTFAELKIKVLWKFELEELPNKPANVVIRKWFNQPSILAHPNVKLFISHGGYLSTTETIFHGKPILGIPVLADQFMNVKNSVKAGFALSMDLKTLNKEEFKQKIEELWTNPRYSNAVKTLSKRFRDQPLTPMETAIFWVEYVLRHDGAPHIRNAGQDLSFWQYHNIDVYLLLASCIFVVFTLIASLIRFGKKIICASSKSTKKSKKSKIKKN
ncbi:UDP-glucosyltransferase 2-like [Musca domestica]|uniref:UDP-glucuronosyltransferase n=1 Tax=Musca domestica TaxID=7370 RepID=A0ABM3UNT0_MUSDO|nr:UDP-glucosyltransferase 2-like [Musca domestica]